MGLIQMLSLNFRRNREEARLQKHNRQVMPAFFDRYDQLKRNLQKQIQTGGRVYPVLDDIRTSILRPLEKMGYLQKNEFWFSLRSFSDDMVLLDHIIADIKAGRITPTNF